MGGLWTHNKAASKTFISNLQDDYLVYYTYVFCTLKRLKKSSQYAAGEADSTFFFNPNTTLIFWWMIFCGCAMLGQLFQEKKPYGVHLFSNSNNKVDERKSFQLHQ